MIANTYEKKNNNGKNLENTLFLFYRLQCNVVARSNQITKEEAQIFQPSSSFQLLSQTLQTLTRTPM